MSQLVSRGIFSVRTRYVECDAWGEIFLHTWLLYFGEAAGNALGEMGLDLHKICGPSGPIRQASASLNVWEPVSVDRLLEFDVAVEISSPTLGFDARIQARAHNGGLVLADGILHYRRRSSTPMAVQQGDWDEILKRLSV